MKKITMEMIMEWEELLIRLRDKFYSELTRDEHDKMADVCNFLDLIINHGVVF